MKLQLALDGLKTKTAIDLVNATEKYIDIIEIGTPLIKHEGVQVLKKMRSAFPDKDILVDLKTMDVGQYEADFCFDLGADIVTVLGVAHIETIKGSLKSANKHGKKIMVDLINHPNKQLCVEHLNALGVHLIGIHSGIDQQNIGMHPLDTLKAIQPYTTIPLCIAGGIKLSNIDNIIKAQPHTLIVGGEITSSKHPEATAKTIKEMMQCM
jgi:3-hexulose-6-phosphate synthase